MSADRRSNTPKWVRWVLVAPAAWAAMVVTSLGVHALGAIGSSAGLPDPAPYFVSQIIGAVAQPLAFVLAGAKIAPNHHFAAAVVLTAFYAILMTMVFAVAFASGPDAEAWVLAAASVVGIVVTLAVSYRILARETHGTLQP